VLARATSVRWPADDDDVVAMVIASDEAPNLTSVINHATLSYTLLPKTLLYGLQRCTLLFVGMLSHKPRSESADAT